MKPKLLIVDDDEDIRSQMKWVLAEDFESSLAGDHDEAISVFESEDFGVVLLDLGLPPKPNETGEGLRTLEDILERKPQTKVIIISGQSERDNAIKAVDMGAYDFFAKPVDVDELKLILDRAFYLTGLEYEVEKLKSVGSEVGFEGMIGTSPEMQQVFASVRKVARTEVPVLILGESGTGKEMVAQAIHQQSERRDGPFVAINCGAIPDELLESELFGYEKGAFTGASGSRKGRFESANGGTIFLDEVGELPLKLQVKLLRFLQDGKISRLGSNTETVVDARIVAATNSNLEEAQKDGSFREDLFFRLAVVIVNIPPLRSRSGDAAVIAKVFVDKFGPELNSSVKEISAAAKKAINMYSWPGNVRELENRIRRAIIMAESRQLSVDDLDLDTDSGFMTLDEARSNVERRVVSEAITRCANNLTQVAKQLGISRPTLYELMEKLEISRK